MYLVSHAWLYGAVKPFFEQKGIKLLRDDLIYIEKCLTNIPQDRHRKVMREYFNVWNANLFKHKNEPYSIVNPRYEANVYLRSITEKYS